MVAKTTFLRHEITHPSYIPLTAWLRHGPFAMWLVKAARPRKIVELGSHYGYSYFAFCQAVRDAGLTTKCFAVDTWQGDEHSGSYGEDVFAAVQAENRQYEDFSTLLRKTFVEALDDIEDGSVDLLHIDGRHFYEDVKNDFEIWIPKLAKRAIVLFHDTEVRMRNFGVWKYWSELKEDNETFNFPHQHGLGVLFWGDDLSLEIAEFRSASKTDFGRSALTSIFHAHGEALDASLRNAEAEEKYQSTALEYYRALSDLAHDRSHPYETLKSYLVYNTLSRLASSRFPISQRTRARFSQSAQKRDPRRSLSSSIHVLRKDNFFRG